MSKLKTLEEVVFNAMTYLKEKGEMPPSAQIIDESVRITRDGTTLYFYAELTEGSPLVLTLGPDATSTKH